MQQVKINPVTNGYLVQVGCKTVVFENRENMLSELRRYLTDPDEVMKEYIEKEKEFCPMSNVNEVERPPDAEPCKGTLK